MPTCYASIRKVGKRLVDFHVADNNRMAPGQGSLDWPTIVGTLKEIGYDGALTVEFVAPADRTPAAPYPDAIEKNPVDISPEQLKFIQDHGSSLLTEIVLHDADGQIGRDHSAADQVTPGRGLAGTPARARRADAYRAR